MEVRPRQGPERRRVERRPRRICWAVSIFLTHACARSSRLPRPAGEPAPRVLPFPPLLHRPCSPPHRGPGVAGRPFSPLLRLGGILDVFLVGRLGAAAIAGVGVGQLHVFLWTTALWGISAGTTVVTAHLRGAKDPERAAGVAGRLFAAGIGIAAVLAVLGLLGGRGSPG